MITDISVGFGHHVDHVDSYYDDDVGIDELATSGMRRTLFMMNMS